MSENLTTTQGIAAAAATETPSKRATSTPTSTAATAPDRKKQSEPKAANAAATATAIPKQPSKSTLVLKLLARTKGATIAEMAELTDWQPHSTRAFLSGLRKKGMTVTREQRRTGETAYRTGGGAGVAAIPAETPLSVTASAVSNVSADATASVEGGAIVTPPPAATA